MADRLFVTVPLEGRPYYFGVEGSVRDGKPFIENVFPDSGEPEVDATPIPVVMLAWKDDMLDAIQRCT